MRQLISAWVWWWKAFRQHDVLELGDLNKDSWERDSEGEPRDPWQFTNHLPMDRVDDSKAFTFVTSSKGGLGCIGELCKEYGKHVRQHPDEEPVIEIDVGSYLHRDRSRGRVKYPESEAAGEHGQMRANHVPAAEASLAKPAC